MQLFFGAAFSGAAYVGINRWDALVDFVPAKKVG